MNLIQWQLGLVITQINIEEREMLLINAMESALQEGHSREYQNMMKKYFRTLQHEKNTSNE